MRGAAFGWRAIPSRAALMARPCARAAMADAIAMANPPVMMLTAPTDSPPPVGVPASAAQAHPVATTSIAVAKNPTRPTSTPIPSLLSAYRSIQWPCDRPHKRAGTHSRQRMRAGRSPRLVVLLAVSFFDGSCDVDHGEHDEDEGLDGGREQAERQHHTEPDQVRHDQPRQTEQNGDDALLAEDVAEQPDGERHGARQMTDELDREHEGGQPPD